MKLSGLSEIIWQPRLTPTGFVIDTAQDENDAHILEIYPDWLALAATESGYVREYAVRRDGNLRRQGFLPAGRQERVRPN